jgi:hypothetical protein
MIRQFPVFVQYIFGKKSGNNINPLKVVTKVYITEVNLNMSFVQNIEKFLSNLNC